MSELVDSMVLPAGQVIALRRGDLTGEEVDGIVNAANSALLHGGGVAGAIVRRGGAVIQEESSRLAPVPVGGAVLTGAGALSARYVIHAVGPRMGEGDEHRKLAGSVRSALELAETHGMTAVALPAISSGIFGFPKDRCAEILVGEAEAFCRARPGSALREIRFTLIDEETLDSFRREFRRRFGDPGARRARDR